MGRGAPLIRQWNLLKTLQAHRFGMAAATCTDRSRFAGWARRRTSPSTANCLPKRKRPRGPRRIPRLRPMGDDGVLK